MLRFEPAIYCGTYAKYNDGDLSGKWLKFTDFLGAEEFLEACKLLHQDELNAEFMFQDFENFPREIYNESMSLEDIKLIYKYIELCEDYEQSLVDEIISSKSWLNDDVETKLQKTFYLTNDDDRDFNIGVAYVENMGGIESLSREELEQYFNYDAFGRDLKINTDIIKTANGEIYYSYK